MYDGLGEVIVKRLVVFLERVVVKLTVVDSDREEYGGEARGDVRQERGSVLVAQEGPVLVVLLERLRGHDRVEVPLERAFVQGRPQPGSTPTLLALNFPEHAEALLFVPSQLGTYERPKALRATRARHPLHQFRHVPEIYEIYDYLGIKLVRVWNKHSISSSLRNTSGQ